MAEDFKYDVFLSHSAKDKAIVRAVAERLRTDGLRVWFDDWEIKPGDNIPTKIEEGLEHSRVLVLCMSANALGSYWAQLEAGTFRFRDPLNKERRLIPLRLDETPIKGSLSQFLYINWREGESAYAKLVAACRGDFQLAPSIEPPSRVRPSSDTTERTKVVQVVHSGTGDIVMGNKTESKRRVTFTPGPEHISPETARQLTKIVDELVERLTVSGGDVGKAYRRVWGDFNATFNLTTYKELSREKAEDGISYLRQWRASKNSKLRFADPEKFRTAQLRGIWPRSKALGFTDLDLYAFAVRKLKLKSPIDTLDKLGNQQIARLNRFLIYEERKLKQGSRRTPTPTPQTKSSARFGGGSPKRVLIVEDCMLVGQSIANLFQSVGWSVSLTHTLEAAVELALRDPPRLILMEVWLANPRIRSGIDEPAFHPVVEAFRKACPNARIVAMDSYGLPDSVKKLFDRVVSKPVSLQVIASLIDEL